MCDLSSLRIQIALVFEELPKTEVCVIKQHTVMAEDILNTEGQSALDASCLKLLSHKQILARIAKRCVDEVSAYSIREIMDFIEGDPIRQRKARDFLQNTEKIIGMNTVDKDPQEGEVIYDILFRMRIPGEENAIEVILNIEAQQKYPSGYPCSNAVCIMEARLSSNRKTLNLSIPTMKKSRRSTPSGLW